MSAFCPRVGEPAKWKEQRVTVTRIYYPKHGDCIWDDTMIQIKTEDDTLTDVEAQELTYPTL